MNIFLTLQVVSNGLFSLDLVPKNIFLATHSNTLIVFDLLYKITSQKDIRIYATARIVYVPI